jgi:hypothetical protein
MSTTAEVNAPCVITALELVSQIDLSPINKKLQYENPAQWTDDAIAEAETNYRRFLALNLLYPSTTFSVNKVLDDYWHQHILDTRKYAEDCEKVYGYFLHHYPYFGIDGGEDRQKNEEAFTLTQETWENIFGVPLVQKPKLTLDKVLGGYPSASNDLVPQRIYAGPQACKCGQHCNKVIVPGSDPQDPEREPQNPVAPRPKN